MGDGDITRINEIKRMDVIKEFWGFFDLWRERQKNKLNEHRRKKQELKK